MSSFIVNGQSVDSPDETTVASLLTSLGYQDFFVAVAINQECVPRSQFQITKIPSGANVEILAPMAGG